MKVFLTGATGYIGAAVAKELVAAGHEVTGLARTEAKAAGLAAAGLVPVVGDLKDAWAWRDSVDAADALIHAGFEYGPKAVEADRRALDVLLDRAHKAGKPRVVVYTSGVWVLGRSKGRVATEDSSLDPFPIVAWRPDHERRVVQAAGAKVATVVLRPGCVYGGKGGMYGQMFASAVERRAVRLVGDGGNCWASVDLTDLARLYRLVVEKAPVGLFHATDGSRERMRHVAQAILDSAGGGSRELSPPEQASAEMGPFADALAGDQYVASEKAFRLLGWEPKRKGFVANAKDLFAEWRG